MEEEGFELRWTGILAHDRPAKQFIIRLCFGSVVALRPGGKAGIISRGVREWQRPGF